MKHIRIIFILVFLIFCLNCSNVEICGGTSEIGNSTNGVIDNTSPNTTVDTLGTEYDFTIHIK